MEAVIVDFPSMVLRQLISAESGGSQIAVYTHLISEISRLDSTTCPHPLVFCLFENKETETSEKL